jgi:hypothetical protein
MGSVPDEVLDFSIDLILAMGSTQPQTEMKTRSFPGVKGGWNIKLIISSQFVTQFSRKCGSPLSHNLMGLHSLLQG